MLVRRIVLLLSLCLFAFPPLHAQTDAGPQSGGPPPNGGPPPGGRPSPAQELERLNRSLTLSDAQKGSILPILEQRQTSVAALMQSNSDQSSRREAMHTLMTSTNSQIRALLTEAQQKIFDSMRHGPAAGPRNGQDGGNPQSPPPDGGGPPQP